MLKTLAALALFTLPALATTDDVLEALSKTRSYWPTRDWQTAIDSHRLQSTACREFEYALYGENQQNPRRRKAKDPKQQPLRTDGVVVVRHGRIVYEWYDGFYGPETPHCMWSASKSANAAILGTAVQEGKVSLNDRLETFFPASRRKVNDPNGHFYPQVTVRDLLGMNSGFDWREVYDGDIKNSSVTKMLYLEGYHDMAQYAIDTPMFDAGPGNRHTYSSANTSLLQGILKKVYGDDYRKMPWTRLYNRIGMKHMVMEADQNGVYVGSSYIHASVRDMAKLGFLYLNDGLWRNEATGRVERVLPQEFVTLAHTITPGAVSSATPTQYLKDSGIIGAGAWWINVDVPTHGLTKFYPNAPGDLFFAGGHYGQMILVLPSQDLVVARVGHDTEYDSKVDRLTRLAVDCFAM